MLTFQLLILTIFYTLPSIRSTYPTESWKDTHKTIEDGRIWGKEAIDISSDPYTFESESLPDNRKFNPSVGNGHLATTIYGDAIFVNGIYNGVRGWSHRARIPSIHSSNFSFPDDECGNPFRFYKLDLQNATYQETMVLPGGTVKYQVYAHQVFNRLLVTEVIIERNLSSSCGPCCSQSIVATRLDLGSSASEDLAMQPPQSYASADCDAVNATCWIQSGEIRDPEKPATAKTQLSIVWNEMPSTFLLPQGQTSARWTFVQSVDQQTPVAQEDFDRALELLSAGNTEGAEGLHLDHREAFQTGAWAKGDIEVGGDLHLQKVVRGCLYYLYTSLPSHSSHSPNNQFYGLSPGGLPNGANGTDYQGHVFWDMETWMYPGILMLRPDLARDMLSYRIHLMDPAFERAAAGNYSGTRFPWESAFTGIEVTPVICPACAANQQHITGDIAYAARQYLSATRDEDWLRQTQAGTNYTGMDFLLEMARFWNSRPSFNATKQRYDINGVMPPDEHAENVNNSVYTNLIASYSVHFARYAACLIDLDYESLVPDSWINQAQNLAFMFQAQKRYHEEYEGYDYELETNSSDIRGVKQADVVMLGFPLMWSMPADVRQNDLEWYETVTHPNGPAMTWGVFSTGWLDLGQFAKADELFTKAYSSYAREPFKVWTEVQSGDGAVNFITGMGGFLQTVLFGYGGMRLDVEELRFHVQRLPPGTTSLTLRNVNYMEMEFDVALTSNLTTVSVISTGSHQLFLNTTNPPEEIPLTPDLQIDFVPQEFSISVASITNCPLLTAINVDYGAEEDPSIRRRR